MNVSFPFIPCLLPDAWLRRIGEMFLESLRGRSWPSQRKLALSHGGWGKARQMSAPLALHWHCSPVTQILSLDLWLSVKIESKTGNGVCMEYQSKANKCKAQPSTKNPTQWIATAGSYSLLHAHPISCLAFNCSHRVSHSFPWAPIFMHA